MRKIERTGQFKRDYKREAKGQQRTSLDADLVPAKLVVTKPASHLWYAGGSSGAGRGSPR